MRVKLFKREYITLLVPPPLLTNKQINKILYTMNTDIYSDKVARIIKNLGLADENGEITEAGKKMARFEAKGLEIFHTYKVEKEFNSEEFKDKTWYSVKLVDTATNDTVKVSIKNLFGCKEIKWNFSGSAANILADMINVIENAPDAKCTIQLTAIDSKKVPGQDFQNKTYFWKTVATSTTKEK